MQILHNNTEADDVLQDVLLQVWGQESSDSSEKGPLMTWLCTLARRRAIDRLRQQIACRCGYRPTSSCRFSKNANVSHTVECEAFRDDLRLFVASALGRAAAASAAGDPSGVFRRDEPARDLPRSSKLLLHRENANRTRYQKTLSCLRRSRDRPMNSTTSFAAIIARCVVGDGVFSERLA